MTKNERKMLKPLETGTVLTIDGYQVTLKKVYATTNIITGEVEAVCDYEAIDENGKIAVEREAYLLSNLLR